LNAINTELTEARRRAGRENTRATPCGNDVGVTAQAGIHIDVETCRVCGGTAKVIACIEDPVVIETILAHIEAQALNMVFFMVLTLMTTGKPAPILDYFRLFTIEWSDRNLKVSLIS